MDCHLTLLRVESPIVQEPSGCAATRGVAGATAPECPLRRFRCRPERLRWLRWSPYHRDKLTHHAPAEKQPLPVRAVPHSGDPGTGESLGGQTHAVSHCGANQESFELFVVHWVDSRQAITSQQRECGNNAGLLRGRVIFSKIELGFPIEITSAQSFSGSECFPGRTATSRSSFRSCTAVCSVLVTSNPAF